MCTCDCIRIIAIISLFVCVGRVVIDLATAPPVLAPRVTMAGRTAADVAQVAFEPQSMGIFTVRYYFANDTSNPDLVYIRICQLNSYCCDI